MTWLDLFRLFAVTAMLVCYALEHRSQWRFAVACWLGSLYGSAQGASLMPRTPLPFRQPALWLADP